MCDIWKDPRRTELPAEELERHLEDIEKLSVKWVVFSGGEPLMHSDLFRLCTMLRSRHIRVTLLSTGLLLKRNAERIGSQVDDVIVSLDGPPAVHDRVRRVAGAFSRLAEGVRAIRENNACLSIAARCTVQKSNHSQLAETAAVAHSLGLQSISFLAADLTSEAFNRPAGWDSGHLADVALTKDEIVILAAEMEIVSSQWEGTGFVLENSDKLNRIVRHFQAHLGIGQTKAPICNAPWVSAVVEADGTVRPCFFHRPVGSLRTASLFQILNGFEAQAFRRSLDIATNPICQRCVCSLYLPLNANPEDLAMTSHARPTK